MGINRKKIVHLTSAHSRYDIRIYKKMCVSLSKKYKVNLVVADGNNDEVTNDGIFIYDVGEYKGRKDRMLYAARHVFDKACELDGDLYHLHDPELIPMGLKLMKIGHKVIFDAHEDLPKQLKSKPYLNNLLRKVLPVVFSLYEKYAFKRMTALIGATPAITNKLLGINSNSVNINNYPILGELEAHIPIHWDDKKDEVCYLGGISEIRGIRELVSAFKGLHNVKLNLAGEFSQKSLEEEIKRKPEWFNVNELGFVSRQEATEILGRSKAGVVTFHPCPNHVDAQPNKMFEYMSARLPIITSNFPMWREVVEGNNCGICVNPQDPVDISKAIEFILSNPKKAREMGDNGYRAVQEKYNWCAEEKALFKLYKEVLS